MNFLKKHIFMLFMVVWGTTLTVLGVLLFNFGIDYETKTTRDVTLVDTSSTTYQHKQNINFNTTGFFVDNVTGQKFRHSIQDKLYADFQAGGHKPIEMKKDLSQENLDNNVHSVIWKMLGILMGLIGSCMVIFILINVYVTRFKKS